MPRSPLVALAASLLLPACGGSDPASNAPPPVIVVHPGEGAGAEAGAGEYAGAAWDTAAAATAKETVAPNGEPTEVIALLAEFEAELVDPPQDATSGLGHDDLLSALAVVDARYLFARVLTREPMSVPDNKARELRFWLEQGGKMVTVEVKVGSEGAPCELLDAAGADADTKVVPGCFWLGNALDLRIPLDAIPKAINVAQPFWMSGMQTCCADEARNQPVDAIGEAQEVWRVSGLAAEGEAPDGKPYTPGKESEGEAPNVP